jgi:hypothetical protein
MGCTDCENTGRALCPDCGGCGYISRDRFDPFSNYGHYTDDRDCLTCSATGEVACGCGSAEFPADAALDAHADRAHDAAVAQLMVSQSFECEVTHPVTGRRAA